MEHVENSVILIMKSKCLISKDRDQYLTYERDRTIFKNNGHSLQGIRRKCMHVSFMYNEKHKKTYKNYKNKGIIIFKVRIFRHYISGTNGKYESRQGLF